MSSQVIRNNEEQGATRYGKIGLAIYLISLGLIYLIPNSLPDGTMYVWAGVLIFVVTILNLFKGIAHEWFDLLLATVAVVTGLNIILDLELNFLYIMLVLVGVCSLLKNIKRPKINNLSS